jgi:hypothetical protein
LAFVVLAERKKFFSYLEQQRDFKVLKSVPILPSLGVRGKLVILREKPEKDCKDQEEEKKIYCYAGGWRRFL